MSCQHAEDVCQHCVEKVHTTTEDAQPPKKRKTTTKKTMTPREKRISILVESSILAVVGSIWYISTKPFFNIAINIFDSILDTIVTPTE